MREIKFRCYIEKKITQEDEGFMHYPEDKSDFLLSSNGNGFGLVVDHDSWGDEDGFHVMQYTGLKDKNGKEIYEGDIVKHDKSYVWSVIFQSDESRFSLKCKPPLIRPLFRDRAYHLEVIGNVYQNPELIKDK